VLHQLSGSTIDGAVYTVDSAGNRNSKADELANVTTNYGYDSIYEILQATQGSTTTESYSYDPVGNRLSSLGMSSYTNNASNELTGTSNASYTYDYNGNTTSKTDSTGTTSYSWDYENRLTSVTLPNSGGTVTFKYDPFGRRIEKISPTTTSIFVYEGDNLVQTVNSTGGLVGRYTETTNIDEPLAMQRGGTTDYYEQDGLGSVTSLTATNGSIVQNYTYDSFGNTTASTGSLRNYFQYTGREFDTETNLYYYRARYYDPTTGRFFREDPLKGVSDGVDFYSYVHNSPISLIDPLGLSPDCPCKAAPKLRLVPISDCPHPGYRRIVYELQGPGAPHWWVTEHQNPPRFAGSSSGQSTGEAARGFDDTIFGWDIGNSLQTFTISPDDPTKSPNTPSCPVNVQLPSGPNGQPKDYGTLGIWHGGLKGNSFINGNSSGWVPCNPSYDEPGYH